MAEVQPAESFPPFVQVRCICGQVFHRVQVDDRYIVQQSEHGICLSHWTEPADLYRTGVPGG